MNTMTPFQKLMHLILVRAAEAEGKPAPEGVTAENIQDLYDEESEGYALQDVIYQVREGDVETKLPSQHSRHYEAKEVAAQAPDGSWIGWTYWYGGGKHGEPEAIDWMEDAYNLTCTEVMEPVRKFAKAA